MALYSRNYIIILFLFVIGIFSSCTNRTSSNRQLRRIDTLMDKRPDLALSLLRKMSDPQKMSKPDQAYFALLYAAATDKNELPLLPCDSLLNTAIDYYKKNDIGKAVALLYKGRLQAQMNDEKAAITTSLKAIDILQNYPEDTKYRRLLYSSLGLWYAKFHLYDKALEILNKSLSFSFLPKDSSIAYSNISYVYTMKDKKDSAIIYQQKSLTYAKRSDDANFITTSWFNTSLRYDYFEETDSAIIYAKRAIQETDISNKDYGDYCYNLGDLYIDTEDYDSAQYYLNKSLKFTGLKYMNYWSLSILEANLDHYQKAYQYLNRFVEIGDSLSKKEQITEAQHMVYKHQTEMKVKDEQMHYHHIIGWFSIIILIICFIFIIYFQNKINLRKKQEALYLQSIEFINEKIHTMQLRINENESFIKALQNEQNKNLNDINKREKLIKQLREEKFKLRTWLFEQTLIYKKINSLTKQNVSNKKERRILSNIEMNKLKQTIFEIYTEYVSSLKAQYPRLTEDDLFYLCMQQIGFSSLTIAMCFGFSDTIAINQRKSRLKGKMSQQ